MTRSFHHPSAARPHPSTDTAERGCVFDLTTADAVRRLVGGGGLRMLRLPVVLRTPHADFAIARNGTVIIRERGTRGS